MKNFNACMNYVSSTILDLCTIGLIVLACNYFTSKESQIHHSILTVLFESLYNNKQYCYFDNLINAMNRHKYIFGNKYEAVLEGSTDTLSTLKTWLCIYSDSGHSFDDEHYK